jgi:predicted metal-dependent hydrolase
MFGSEFASGILMLNDPTTPQLTLWPAGDATGAWTVRESGRARRLAVRVFRTGRVEVVIPRRTSQRIVARFLDEHRGWIESKRAEAQRNIAPVQPFPPKQIELTSCGESWRVHVGGGAAQVRVRVIAPELLSLTGNTSDTRAVRRALHRWLMAQALEVLAPMLAEVAREHRLSYRKVAIRRQRTRWGSCSSRGTISLNCTLLFQRPPVVRYLLIHELVHTLHMNHSKRFWECVGRLCPDFETLDRELREGWRRVPGWVFDR